jgi:hypothetical protein
MERSRVISTDAVSGTRSKVCNSLLCYCHVLIQHLSSAGITQNAFKTQIKCEFKQQCCQLQSLEKMCFGKKMCFGLFSLGRNANLIESSPNSKFFLGLRFGFTVGRNTFYPKTGTVNINSTINCMQGADRCRCRAIAVHVY